MGVFLLYNVEIWDIMKVGFICTEEEHMSEESMNNEKEKCFVIMPISDQGDYPKGHFEKVYEQIFVPAIEATGYDAFRVDEDNMCTPIVEKIFKAIQECPMALCDLSNRNPNVLYELGIRQAYDKPVVLVKDEKTERIFDVSGINTISYMSTRLYEEVLDARKRISDAIISMKEGKQNSIIKVLNAQKAMVSSDSMTKEEKIEILLSGLVKDVNDLKNQDRQSMIESVYNKYPYNNWENSYVKEKNGLATLTYFISLKKDITDNEIKRVVDTVSNHYNVKINYIIDDDVLCLEIVSDDMQKCNFVYKDLEIRLRDRERINQ